MASHFVRFFVRREQAKGQIIVIQLVERLSAILIIGLLLAACGDNGEDQTKETFTPAATLTATADAFSTLIAMQATAVPSVTPWPTHTPTYTPTTTATPTLTRTFTLTPTDLPQTTTAFPINTLRATQTILEAATPISVTQVAMYTGTEPLQDHYVLARPFPRDPSNTIRDWASRSYPFGTTGGGQFNTHHGVDIQNPQGTPILAVASGWVIYAGPDDEVMFGPQNDFYGILAVIEHDFPAPNGEKLYTLYGHMSKVQVETGQRVEQGQIIGNVGSTGVALGAHLHLEVRLGDPSDYNNVYNPDLWVRPWPTYGTLAGRIFNSDGTRTYGIMITIQAKNGDASRYTFSYSDDTIKSDPYYGEHFTYADLPEGDYEVFVRVRSALVFKQDITIAAGQTNWLDIHLK